MSDYLEDLASYICDNTSFVLGVDAFVGTMPSAPVKCFALYEVNSRVDAKMLIHGAAHEVQGVVRGNTHEETYENAIQIYELLRNTDDAYKLPTARLLQCKLKRYPKKYNEDTDNNIKYTFTVNVYAEWEA